MFRNRNPFRLNPNKVRVKGPEVQAKGPKEILNLSGTPKVVLDFGAPKGRTKGPKKVARKSYLILASEASLRNRRVPEQGH